MSIEERRMLETLEALDDIKAGRVVCGIEIMKWLDSWGDEEQKYVNNEIPLD